MALQLIQVRTKLRPVVQLKSLGSDKSVGVDLQCLHCIQGGTGRHSSLVSAKDIAARAGTGCETGACGGGQQSQLLVWGGGEGEGEHF